MLSSRLAYGLDTLLGRTCVTCYYEQIITFQYCYDSRLCKLVSEWYLVASVLSKTARKQTEG